jgi:cyclopropane fatty-acyl-phospholipid synthase-like methyltransferase
MTNSKTIISYNGGSAGDLFTLSCNSEPLLGLTRSRVVQPSTLKDYEGLVQKGLAADLDTELNKIPYRFVSTHLLDEVVGQDVYNIVIDDPEVQLYTIYRQMYLQKLRIIINHEHIWFNTVKNFCLEKEYVSAAKYWFENAKKLWLDRMEYRIKFDKCKKLNFNKLFTDDFVDDLNRQGWTHNISLITSNHKEWLKENKKFSYQNTIDTMANKLSTMNWHQEEGWIEYTPKHIFESAKEFLDLDNRRLRYKQTTTLESLTNKLLVQLPADSIKDKTILDLGSCLGAAGHHALTYGASHYTGVELQPYYFDTSKQILSKYWKENQYNIVQQDVEEFLDIAIAENRKYDYVLAAGIIYGFVDIVSILKKISKVTNTYVMIDTLTVHVTTDDPNSGIILINKQGMVKGKHASSSPDNIYFGIGSTIDLRALDMVMSTLEFERKENIILPELITDTVVDAYNTPDPAYFKNVVGVDFSGPSRYMTRYTRVQGQPIDTVQSAINTDVNIEQQQWVFDSSVADRFQHEAETNIPSYQIVIDKCLQFANKHIQKSDKIIDVGSALGHTMEKFTNAGFTNVLGVDNSPSMNEKNKYPTICSDKLPDYKYKLVMMNWTLHFVQDKYRYLSDIYDKLDDGYLILTDKTSQSEVVKELYYDFKRSKGVSEEYIRQKEKNLVGVMHSVPVDWYLKTLREIGFTVDIIHADLGFITFMCSKT